MNNTEDEMMKKEYDFQGEGDADTDSIKCWDCKTRITVEESSERSDGHYVCEDCYITSLEFNK